MKKILILSANPKDTIQIRLDEEVREIQAALERPSSRAREEFELITRWAVRIDDLRRTLLDKEPQIVHFSGHATKTNHVDFEKNYGQHQRDVLHRNSQPSGIVLEDNSGQVQLVSTNSLATLFELCKNSIECVLLNACYSEAQAEAIYQHIDCVIGMERAITDKAAINFSVAFYDALSAGRNYKDAFEFGRNNIDLNGIPEFLTPKIKFRNNSNTLKQSSNPDTITKLTATELLKNFQVNPTATQNVYHNKIATIKGYINQYSIHDCIYPPYKLDDLPPVLGEQKMSQCITIYGDGEYRNYSLISYFPADRIKELEDISRKTLSGKGQYITVKGTLIIPNQSSSSFFGYLSDFSLESNSTIMLTDSQLIDG
ncbi:CHAT domain-containing protein [Scytonema sp. UIC 10036]|uniref:CHAT domain-containing protein n=1 Tax=Scytonema sp. UIC 10036 TaxID=2304196 RepID=UPI0012DA35E8|nr:CHAT domain-containing protein [Scytonema sp. UIC 10036]MUG93619.1 CHAT domain-containing protein [Scytonema sp. UIC 10036]